MPNTPYWRIWMDLARDLGKRPLWLRKRVFVWWDSLSERLG